jgi:hypothetical protein
VDVAFCCVVDEKTKYLAQAVRWAQAIRWVGGKLADASLFVGTTDGCPAGYAREFDRLGVQRLCVARASDWHGPSNKIGVLACEEMAGFKCVVLSDCDVAFVADISQWLTSDSIAAKPADLATLGNDLLAELFRAAGKAVPQQRLLTSIDRVPLIPYCNSGVVLLGESVREDFVALWMEFNRFLLGNRRLLGTREFFCDQASFALALNESKGAYRELPIAMNFPCHLRLDSYPTDVHSIVPMALHYHDRVDGRTGYLMATGMPGPDDSIARFNARLSRERRSHLANTVFWDERYNLDPELGSGIGSRGEHARYKAAIVETFLRSMPECCVIDFGCGDCSLLEHVNIARYIGVDASSEVISRNRRSHPGHAFVCGLLPDVDAQGEVSICFDLLIHQATLSEFDAVLDRILAASSRGGLVNGFDKDPGFASDIIFFHTPLCEALAKRGVDHSSVGEYRGTVIYQWSKGRRGVAARLFEECQAATG